MCIYFRTLNSRTIPDQYVTPRIDDALDCLTGSRWLDLRSGYYQIAMSAEDREKSAFICPLGFYQFQRMPQGITGAPVTFQRLMERVVGNMHLLQVIVYLDEIIVFGRTLEEHKERLMKVLDRLEEWGLKVSIDKCQVCQRQVKYVGHIVSAAGIAPDPEKVSAVTRWEEPTDLKSLRSFLGFCGFYRRFIKGYSSVVRPLTELTKGYPPVKRSGKKNAKNYYKEKDPFGARWDEACGEAFKTIIHCLTNAPVLAFADTSLLYVLHVDASLSGLGAVFNQEHPEGLRPIAFASRKLSTSEQHYPMHQFVFIYFIFSSLWHSMEAVAFFSLPVLTLIFPALLPCLVLRVSLCTALQTERLWINWSLNAIDTIEDIYLFGTMITGIFADWIRLCPGLSKNSEDGNSCPKTHKAARLD